MNEKFDRVSERTRFFDCFVSDIVAADLCCFALLLMIMEISNVTLRRVWLFPLQDD